MIFTMLFGAFGRNKKTKKSVNSVEAMTLVKRGMRGEYVYKLESEDNATKLRYYREVYSGGETVLELVKSVACDRQVIIELMNTCNIIRWDGFHGKHPKNVHDGIMFTFTAMVNGGQTVCAEGSANFPSGYHEFVRSLDAMLTKG